MSAPHVIIVGAGLGGLSAAISAASAGLRVTVLEAHAQLGGKAGEVEIDGVRCDTGPSVLTLPHLVDAALRPAGTCLKDELTLITHAPAFRYLYPDGVSIDVHTTPEQTLDSVRAALGSRDADELARFLSRAKRIWDAASGPFVLGEAPTPGAIWRLGPRAWTAVTHIDPLRSMWGAICADVSSPHLRALLARYATYNGSDVRVAPATLNCIAWVELGLGTYGIQGGVHALVHALSRVAQRQGAELRTDARVARITREAGRISGVELHDGTTLRCDALVCNADVAHLAETLLAPDPAGLSAPRQPSTSGWTGIFQAQRRTGADARVPHTVLFPQDYLDEFRDMFDHGRPPQSPTLYLCAQEPCHGRTGWADHEPVFAMANAPAEPAHQPSDPAVHAQLREASLARLHASGLLDPTDALRWERTPAELAAQFPGSRGGLYGAASNSRFAAFARPPNRISRLPGLYLASGSAHPGGGMPLCVRSGQAAAQALLHDLRWPVTQPDILP